MIILSPGNLTTAGFYASIAEDLAGHGYVVVGIDHPYQVAASSCSLARQRFTTSAWIWRAGGSKDSLAYLRFALDRLAERKARDEGIGGHLYLARVGVMGHSNEGIAAVETCRMDPRFRRVPQH